MTTYERTQVVKILADPKGEARMIMFIADGPKPLICRPVSEIYVESPATEPETYAPDEVRPALLQEYVLKTPREIVRERTFRALDDFRKQIPSDRLFESFQRVIALFRQDERPGPEAQKLVAAVVDRANRSRLPWSAIMTGLLLDPQVPQVVYETLVVLFYRVISEWNVRASA
ncbi:hypothetical protein [Hymenobacter jeollabukensis]|uniref:Uncharacterized protein n=1 Tax=Hymenobacter jeollabukensis TaxID=2025313 RepID=A0A5R8WIT4_9BACT|nr:hypothetical protein [Hymenobacter jeollabukensis]TLM88660.1 hypothetical protein FDY95_22760 [Hymenobacter jeollabukensis]